MIDVPGPEWVRESTGVYHKDIPATELRAEAAERERDELRRTLDMGFVEVRDRMQAAEAKLAAIRARYVVWVDSDLGTDPSDVLAIIGALLEGT